jgi:PAS domain-containing protein
MRHPDTITETPAPAAEAPATSRRALLRGIGLASVGAAALAAGCTKGEAAAAPATAPAAPVVDKSVAIMGANESPFGPSKKAVAAMIEKASLTARYADPEGEELKKQIAAIEASDDGIAVTDAEGRFMFMNRGHATMFGYPDAESLIGQPWCVLYDEDNARHIT